MLAARVEGPGPAVADDGEGWVGLEPDALGGFPPEPMTADVKSAMGAGAGLTVMAGMAPKEWRVESGEWRVESGEWRVKSGE